MKITVFLLFAIISSCSQLQTPTPFEVTHNSSYPLIITAPHCGFDLETDKIVKAITQKLKNSSVIACGFRSTELPVNVNRPTDWKTDVESPKAKEVYTEFSDKIKKLWAPGIIYIEIHGHHRTDSSIEIAQVGFSKEKWEKVQMLFEEEKEEEALNWKLLFEGKDKLAFEAKGSKEKGTLSEFQPALHIEISSDLRKNDINKVVEYLEQVFSGLTEI